MRTSDLSLGLNGVTANIVRKRRKHLAWALLLLLLLQPACLFKRKPKAEAPATSAVPVRVVMLPANVPDGNTELRWLATAIPAMMARAALAAKDLEVVPLWESMPIAVDSAGDSRVVTAEIAAYAASRLAARWAVEVEVAPQKNGLLLLIDFIPAKSTQYAYRYRRVAGIEDLGTHCHAAVTEFLRYLVAGPPAKTQGRGDSATARALGQTLDREYGWFVAAEPGKSEQAVAGLMKADGRLARILFSPNLYPELGPPPGPAGQPAKPPTINEVTTPPTPPPSAPSTAAEPSKDSGGSPTDRGGGQPPRRGPPETSLPAASEFEQFVPPPPQTFSQTLSSAALGAGSPRKDAPVPGLKSRERGVPPNSARGLRIQVFSSRSRPEAENLAERLRKAAYTPEIEEADLQEKGTWYRIRLSGFASRKAALAAGEKLVSEGLIREFWLVP